MKCQTEKCPGRYADPSQSAVQEKSRANNERSPDFIVLIISSTTSDTAQCQTSVIARHRESITNTNKALFLKLRLISLTYQI